MKKEIQNESVGNIELTMLDALQQLWHFKAKRSRITFEITFKDVSRNARFGKYWSKLSHNWNYFVQDGDNAPSYVYSEREVVSAIMSITGMSLYGNSVRYQIKRII